MNIDHAVMVTRLEFMSLKERSKTPILCNIFVMSTIARSNQVNNTYNPIKSKSESEILE